MDICKILPILVCVIRCWASEDDCSFEETIKPFINHYLEDGILHLQNEFDERFTREFNEQKEIINELRQSLAEEKETNLKLNLALKENFKQSISIFTNKLNVEFRKLYSKISKPLPDRRNEFSSYGCLSDVLTMSCPVNRTLFLTTGVYGQYADSCATCCVPGGSDCTELIEDNRPQDWTYLKLLCDNQTSCSFEYTAALVNECEEGYVADYIEIFYNCYPLDEIENSPIGFTVYATEDRQYTTYEEVQFHGIVSNVGNHYNSNTSRFYCPHSGVYMFSLNVMAYEGYNVFIEIWRDDESLIKAWADGVIVELDGVYQQSSAFVIAECAPGQEVWVRAGYNSYLHGSSQRYSHFAGYLLHRYD